MVKYILNEKTLDKNKKQILKSFILGLPQEDEQLFIQSPTQMLSLVWLRMLGAGFMVTDIGWQYAIAYCDTLFSEVRKSKKCKDRMDIWSISIDDMKSFLKKKELVDIAAAHVAKARLDMGLYNEWGYAFAASDLDALTKKKLDLRSFLNLVGDDRIPLSQNFFEMYHIPYDELMGRLAIAGIDKDKDIRERIIMECKGYLE